MPIMYGLNEREYNALPALRSSTINAVLDSPARYRAQLDTPATEKHYTLGSATHALALENGKDVVLALKGDRVPGAPLEDWRTKEARTIRDTAIAQGKYPLTGPEFDHADAMALAIVSDPRVSDHIATGDAEVTITGTDNVTFAALKARVDVLDVATRTIVDIKSCASARPADFPSTVLRYGYHISADQYRELVAQATGTDPDEWTFLFALVEKEAPYMKASKADRDSLTIWDKARQHLTHVTKLSPAYQRLGARDRRKGIDIYLECDRTGVWPMWPGHGTDITITDPPKWALDRH
jgi:hypothetical protein